MKKKKAQIDNNQLRKSVEQAIHQPRLAFYSPLSAAVMNYWKNAVPRYSISDELAKIVEAALAKKYPELTRRVTKMLKSGKKGSKSSVSTRARLSQEAGEG
ncbi:MAG: hypothetical protein QXN23_06165 [Candidatus Caldarchaeum sp.]|uniref:Uncharacterized protein n=1 Tax=Caldiarchaeum subterraneum TaxID=311458 RepID=A0A7C4I6M4_CALS0|nr:hypothetical protein [Candidatus Caldarchaeales archaeon]MDJ0273021.1 hypothetical protein [Candidatus Caldarchaeales archaeon]